MPRGKQRYWSKDDIIRDILHLKSQGESLVASSVSRWQGALYAAAFRYFEGWREALAAAGIDADAVCPYRSWTPESVIEAIRRLDRQGTPLHFGSILRLPGGLSQAGVKHFGSWDEALRAAGYEPDRIRRNRRPITREELLNLIRTRAALNLPIKSYNVRPHGAKNAANRLFGSWRAALRAAGVPDPYGRRWPQWTQVSVVEAILIRQHKGQSLRWTDVARDAPRLAHAAWNCFGSWFGAIEAAGIDSATVRHYRPPYTREEIIEHLRRRAKANQPFLRPSHHPDRFARAARRLFGSWADALAAAGVPPAQRTPRSRRRDRTP